MGSIISGNSHAPSRQRGEDKAANFFNLSSWLCRKFKTFESLERYHRNGVGLISAGATASGGYRPMIVTQSSNMAPPERTFMGRSSNRL